MGVLTGSTGPTFGINWNRSATDGGVASDWNAGAHVIEYLARVFFEEILENGVVMASPERCQFNSTTKRIDAPSDGSPIMGVIGGRPFRLTSAMEESGTADSGATTWLRSTDLNPSDDDFWTTIGWVVFTSGANNGEVRQVTGYDESTDELSWTTPLGTAVSAGDTFTVTVYYVLDLTNGATNYIYIHEGGKLNSYGIPTFVATTSSTPSGSDLLIASAVLDGSGNVTSASNSPTNADRRIYLGASRGDIETAEYDYSGLLGGCYTDVTVSHSDFLFIGGRTLSVTGAGVTATMQEHHKPDECVVRLTNGGSYSRSGTLTVTIQGRKLLTL